MLNKILSSEFCKDSNDCLVQCSLEHYGIGTNPYISDVFRKTVEECCSSVPKTVVA